MGIEKQRVVYENGTKLLICVDCGKEFAFPPKEAKFFQAKGFPDPRRCRPCRADHREQRERGQSRTRERRAVDGKATLGDVITLHLGGGT
jgi:hypothetical protein